MATLTPSSNQKVLAAREWTQRRAETAVMSASTPSSRGEVECACGRRQGTRLTEDGACPEPVEGMPALSEGTSVVFTMMVYGIRNFGPLKLTTACDPAHTPRRRPLLH